MSQYVANQVELNELRALASRSQKESPEVDGTILIDISALPDGKKAKFPAGFAPERFIGKFAAVRIVSATEYDLTAVLA